MPFGFRVGDEGELEEVPEEQEAIATMVKTKAKGAGLRGIAAAVRRAHDIKVSHEAVRRVLADQHAEA